MIFNSWIFITFIVLRISAKQTLPLIRVNTFTVFLNWNFTYITFTVIADALCSAYINHVKHGALESMKVSSTSYTRNTSTDFQTSKALVLGIFLQVLQHRLDVYPFLLLHFVIGVSIGLDTFFVEIMRLATIFLLKWTN